MILPTPRNIVASVSDLRVFLSTRERYEWVFAAIAAGITIFIIFAFWHDSRAQPAPVSNIVYVQNWRADRPDSEIVAEQHKERAERDQALAERRAAYQRLQKATAGWL